MTTIQSEKPCITIIKPAPVTNSQFMCRVYNWMTIGILLTAVIAYYIGSHPSWVKSIFENRVYFFSLVIFQISLVLLIAAKIEKLSIFSTIFLYLLYATLVGITFSVIFIRFTESSIVSTFVVTTLAFGSLSLFGYITKRDLGPWGSFLTMGLFGLIGVGLLSIFVPSLMGDVAQKVTGIMGILVFSGLTAYDTQKIKELNQNPRETNKEVIQAALTLYLDFINLFLNILRFCGDNEN